MAPIGMWSMTLIIKSPRFHHVRRARAPRPVTSFPGRSSTVDVDHLDGVVPVAQAVPRGDVGLHVAGGVGRSGPEGVPADGDRIPGEAPVLPLVVAPGWFQVGGLPL